MEQKQEHKKISKALVIPIALVLCFAVVYAGAVLYHNITVTATVSEALSSADVSVSFSGYPGETIVKTITVDNDASVPLNTEVSFVESENLNNVSYTTDMTKTVTLAPGTNTITVQFVYDEDTAIGDIKGDIVLNRVA